MAHNAKEAEEIAKGIRKLDTDSVTERSGADELSRR